MENEAAMALLIRAKESRAEGVYPSNGRAFTLSEIQRIVGGKIQPVHLENSQILWRNVSGRWLTPNFIADRLAHYDHAISEDDYIAGDVLVTDWAEAGEGDEPEAA